MVIQHSYIIDSIEVGNAKKLFKTVWALKDCRGKIICGDKDKFLSQNSFGFKTEKPILNMKQPNNDVNIKYALLCTTNKFLIVLVIDSKLASIFYDRQYNWA